MRVVIGEDEALMRSGLALVLADHGIDVVAQAGDAETLLDATARLEPDLVVTDIRMPPTLTDDGLRAAITIRRRYAGVAVLVLSQHVSRRYALDLVGEQPRRVGYLLKQRVTDPDRFCDDVRRVAGGDVVLDPEVVAAMVDRARRDRTGVERLTPRQLEVLALLAEGHSNAAVARLLSISERAVVQHTSHIYDELDLAPDGDHHRRVLAVLRYLAR